jgi:hypothetical protein
VKEYDLFVPLYYNDGSPIGPDKLRSIQGLLLEHFNGLLTFPQPKQGFWKFGNMTYRDEIVIYRVISQDVAASRKFLSGLKERLKAELRQQELLIIERDIGLV